MEEIITSEMSLAKTLGIKNILGSTVLSRRGRIVGKVTQVEMSKKEMRVEGVVVRKPYSIKKLYIGRKYFEKLSDESIILNIEPSTLLKRRKVISFEGKKIGKIGEIERYENTNKIKMLRVRTNFGKKFNISPENIKYFGKTLILKEDYEPPKTNFWTR